MVEDQGSGGKPPEKEYEGTRVDLGDDLLEKTAVLTVEPRAPSPSPKPPAPGAPPPPPGRAHQAPAAREEPSEILPAGPMSIAEIEDQLQSARILLGEGILEEAKRILRRILLADPGNAASRKYLQEIHEIELRQIFAESPPRRRSLRARPEEETDLTSIKADLVMRDLDRDLKLGIFDETGTGEGESTAAQLSLFQDKKALEEFAVKLDHDLAGSGVQDRIDLGIAFLEMSLYDLAARQFKAASNMLSIDPQGHDKMLSATSLLAYALLLGQRPFEASLTIQPVLRDTDIPRERKIDLIYLMGRAYESLRKPEVALQWYLQAAEVDASYRDVADRIHAIRGGGTRPR